MRALFGALLRWRQVPRRRPPRTCRAPNRSERLEARQLLTITIHFDYSRDTNGFFTDTARQQVLELAGEMLGSRLDDHLQAIAPSGSNTWSLNATEPSGSGSFVLNNQTIPENTVVVFVGSRDISSLAIGGPGGYSASGSSAWLDLVAARGQVGMFDNPETDFGLWGGSITFDDDANWYFGMSADGLGAGQYDFLSVAIHELGHVFGVGTSEAWDAHISGSSFTGPNAVAEFGEDVPLSGSSHFQEGTEDDGQEVAMDPTLLVGTRKLFTKLDYAALADIGWEVNDGDGGEDPGGGDPPMPPPETYTINVDPNRSHTIVIQDDGIAGNGRSRLILDGQSSTFLNPTRELIINGGSRNDVVLLQAVDSDFAARITVNAGAGNDRVDASAMFVSVELWGDRGRDTLIGGWGNDLIAGGNDSDSLIGNVGNDELRGEAGDDRIFAGAGQDTLDGGAGNDNLQGQEGDDALAGGFGNDSLSGGDGDDSLSGEFGRDTLLGGLGNDSLDGGTENDNLQGQAGDDLLLGGDGNDSLSGLDGSDTLRGEVGNDSLLGGLDDDSLLGGDGHDRLWGYSGNDTLNGGSGNDTLQGGTGDDGLSGFSGNDSLLGDDGRDTLFGGDGNDRLRGGKGEDLLRGGLGNDRVDGESEADTVSGGNGSAKDPLDTVVVRADDLVDELFVFDADWIDDV